MRLDPDNADRYRVNAAAAEQRLLTLDRSIAELLQPVRDRPFVVFHDAFQYFDARYSLNAVAAISDNDEHRPGAAHLSSLRRLMRDKAISCVFLEPGADPRLARILEQHFLRTTRPLIQVNVNPDWLMIRSCPIDRHRLPSGLYEGLRQNAVPRKYLHHY